MLNLFRHQDSRPSLPLCPDIIPSISVCTQISLVSIAILWEEKSRYLMYKMPSCIDSWEGLVLEHKTRLSQASLCLPLTFGDLSILSHSFLWLLVTFQYQGGCGWAEEMVISSFHGLFDPFFSPFLYPLFAVVVHKRFVVQLKRQLTHVSTNCIHAGMSP